MKHLLNIAKQVIDLNKASNAAITGSLLFVLEGKKIRRKPKDIDIIVSYLCAEGPGFPIVPNGFELNDMDGSKSEVNAIQFINKDGVKIDFLFSDENRKFLKFKGVDYFVGDLELAIAAKKHYSKHDKIELSRSKHLKDLQYMDKKPILPIGTKSVLYGAHCFLLHPLFVAIAWIRLFGFPYDPRIWLAFFVHDLGYWGKPNMDGPEGETHVELGAKIMHIFDGYEYVDETYISKKTEQESINKMNFEGWSVRSYYYFSDVCLNVLYRRRKTYWRDFSMYHSRYYAKKNNAKPSKLCFADKLSFCTTPRWLYLPMVTATGEINEYLKMAQRSETQHWKPVQGKIKWHNQLRRYMLRWTAEHVDGKEDKWTSNNRHQK